MGQIPFQIGRQTLYIDERDQELIAFYDSQGFPRLDGSTPAPAKEPHRRQNQDLMVQVMQLRLQKHWTQAKLAAEAGIPQSTYARIEDGRLNPTLKTLRKITDALGVRLLLQ